MPLIPLTSLDYLALGKSYGVSTSNIHREHGDMATMGTWPGCHNLLTSPRSHREPRKRWRDLLRFLKWLAARIGGLTNGRTNFLSRFLKNCWFSEIGGRTNAKIISNSRKLRKVSHQKSSKLQDWIDWVMKGGLKWEVNILRNHLNMRCNNQNISKPSEIAALKDHQNRTHQKLWI